MHLWRLVRKRGRGCSARHRAAFGSSALAGYSDPACSPVGSRRLSPGTDGRRRDGCRRRTDSRRAGRSTGHRRQPCTGTKDEFTGMVRPAHSRGHQNRDRYPKASDISSPPCLLRLLPAGAVAGRGLHPLETRRLVTAHVESCHSMTSSARARTDGGIVSPSSLAVFRLTANS